MDRLIIKGIEFTGHCGITEEEMASGQRLSADIEVTLDISKATASDRLEDTVNYVDICDKVLAIGRLEKYNLLETLAERIAAEILKSYNVTDVVIRLRKCSVPIEAIHGYFEVEIKRKSN